MMEFLNRIFGSTGRPHFQVPVLGRYLEDLDPQNIPKIPPQGVFGCLGIIHFQVRALSMQGG